MKKKSRKRNPLPLPCLTGLQHRPSDLLLPLLVLSKEATTSSNKNNAAEIVLPTFFCIFVRLFCGQNRRSIPTLKMIKLFSLKQQKKDGEATPKSGPQKKAFTAAQLRITKDINELNLPKTCATEFPDPDDLLNFKLIICPDEGFYKGGRFVFNFKVGPNYPHEPPKVKCETQVYHPNIDLEGNVCLNILREDWKPVLTINSIVYGLQYLFLEPNPEDPLNREAAEVLQTNRRLFEHNVFKAMRGSYIGETYFERCLK